MIDDVQGLSERSRKVIFGHSTKTNISDGYGPKVINEAQPSCPTANEPNNLASRQDFAPGEARGGARGVAGS
jgi:hypothetical protein